MHAHRRWIASLGLAAGLHLSVLLPGFNYLLHGIKPLSEPIAQTKEDMRHYNRKLAAMDKAEFLRTLEKDMADGRLDSMSFADFFLRAESYFYPNDKEVFIAASDRYYRMLGEIQAVVDGIQDPVQKALAIHRLANTVYHKKYKEDGGRVVEDVQTLEWNCGSKTHALLSLLIDSGVPRGLLGVRGFTDPHQQPTIWTALGWIDFSVTQPEVFRETRERVYPVHILVASYLHEQGRTLPLEYAGIWQKIRPKERPFPSKARGVVANDLPAETRMYKTEEQMRAAIAAANAETSHFASPPFLPPPSVPTPAFPPAGNPVAGTRGIARASVSPEPWLPGFALQQFWQLPDGKTVDDVAAVLEMKKLVLQLRCQLGARVSKKPDEISLQIIHIPDTIALLDSFPVERAKQALNTNRLSGSALEFGGYMKLLRRLAPNDPVVQKWSGTLAKEIDDIRAYRSSLESIIHFKSREATTIGSGWNDAYEAAMEPQVAALFQIMSRGLTLERLKTIKLKFVSDYETTVQSWTFSIPNSLVRHLERMDPADYTNVWPELLEPLLEYNPGIIQLHPVVGQVVDAHIAAIHPGEPGSLPNAAQALRLLLIAQPVDADRVAAFFDRMMRPYPLLDGNGDVWKPLISPLLYGVMDHPELLYDRRIRAQIQRVIARGEYAQRMDDRIFVPYFAEVLRETTPEDPAL